MDISKRLKNNLAKRKQSISPIIITTETADFSLTQSEVACLFNTRATQDDASDLSMITYAGEALTLMFNMLSAKQMLSYNHK